jgi:gamma-glutamyltranspeptidase
MAALRVAELEIRMNGEGSRDTVAHRTLFPDGISAFQKGRQAARVLRMKALAEAMAASAELGARSQVVVGALAAWEQAESAYGAARLASRIAVQAQDAARAAFLSQYRAAFGFATGRLGDTKAARAVFPDLGHAVANGEAQPVDSTATPAGPPTIPSSHAA